jgi:hypothetical protein
MIVTNCGLNASLDIFIIRNGSTQSVRSVESTLKWLSLTVNVMIRIKKSIRRDVHENN